MSCTYYGLGAEPKISIPERLNKFMNMHDAELSIRCKVLYGCKGCFLIKVFDADEQLIVCRTVVVDKQAVFILPAGSYTVRVSSSIPLNPGGITKWVTLPPGKRYAETLIFAPPLCERRGVPVCFTLADANYPGLTELNGGITVWLNKTTQ